MRALLVAMTASTVLAAAAPAGAGAASAPSCARKASATLVANRVARVYTLRGDLWTCVRSTGRRVRLANAYQHDYGSGQWRGVKLAGAFVAWTYESYDISCKAACPEEYNPSRTRVLVHDLRRGRRANEAEWSGGFHLTTGGGVAWLEAAGEGSVLRGKAPRVEPIVLDEGDIAAETVRTYHRLVLWETGGERRWAPLP